MLHHFLLASVCLLLFVNSTTAQEPGRDVLRKQAERCQRILDSSIINFYLPGCLDRANGGYLESLEGNTFVATGEKFITLQARQLWFFSTLAANDLRKDEALKAARHGFDFIEAHFRDRVHGGYFAKVSDAGKPTDRHKHVYLNAFVLYALAAHHRATKDAASLQAAKDLFQVLETKTHDAKHGGYIEYFEEDWKPILDPKVQSFIGQGGTKTFNTHLHVMEALTELYAAWPDAKVRERLEETMLINTFTIYQFAHGCNVDAFSLDWKPVMTPQNQRASYGHDVEGAWLCLDAVHSLGYPPALLRSWSEGIVGYSIRYGYDQQHGGFYYTGPLSKPADDTKKEWWVQAEALVSMLKLYQLTGKREYYDRFAQTLDFVEKHQVAKEGSWWASLKADGSPLNRSRSSMWQGAYHNGRAMMVCKNLLNELATQP